MNKGRDPERMFVHTITVGGSILHKKPDIKGRGRTGVIRKPLSSIRIVLAEKSISDFYKMMLVGEASPGLAAFFRRMVFHNKADFEHIRQTSHLLSARGRRYRRVQFRRLVQYVRKEYKRRGVFMRE